MKNRILPLAALILATTSFNSHAQCAASEQPPSDKPENFNINEHLSKFDQAGQAISKLPSGGAFGQTYVRASLISSMFYSRRKYDVKNNPNYNSSSDVPDEFGNWFYGAAAHQLGYTKQEALVAAAIVQQYQDYNNSGHPDAGDISKMASDIVAAIAAGDGTGDNPGDSADVSGGYDYSDNAYESDTTSGKSSGSSCESSSQSGSDSGGGSSSGYGGGWGGGYFIGAGGCYGSCGGGATGSVTITDLPSESTSEE